MAMKVSWGIRAWNAADAAATEYVESCVDVNTGVSFRPTVVIAMCGGLGGLNDATSTTTHERRSIGVATSPTSRRCCVTQDQDAAAIATCTGGYLTDAVLSTVTSTPARDGALDIKSFDAGGFTWVVDDAAPVDTTLIWVALASTKTFSATIVDIVEPAATGDQDYSVADFDDKNRGDQAVMFCGVQATAADSVVRIDSGLTLGFASGIADALNVCIAVNSADGNSSIVTDSYSLRGECLAMLTVGGGNPNARAKLTQFANGTFRLNWIARGVTNRRYFALALKGEQFQAGGVIVGTAGIGNIASISTPFSPLGLFAFSHEFTESSPGAGGSGSALSMGAGVLAGHLPGDPLRGGFGCYSPDNVGTSAIQLSMQFDELLPFMNGSTYDIDLDRIERGEIRLVWDGSVVGDGDHFVGYLTFGSPETRYKQLPPTQRMASDA